MLLGPPIVELSSTKVDGVEGHDMTLTCTATNDVDSPYDTHITWYGPTGEVIESNDDYIYISVYEIDNVMTSALKFKPINHTQAGINKCKASNHPNSSNEMDVSVEVECKFKQIYLQVTTPLQISCCNNTLEVSVVVNFKGLELDGICQ